MKSKNLIAAVLFISAYFLQSCSNSTNEASGTGMDSSMSMAQHDSMNGGMEMSADLMQSMKDMKDKMSEIKMTGDFDLDFASMMIMHHLAAIDMSTVEIAKGTDAGIKTMAQHVIDAQNTEIEEMQQFIKNYNMPEAKEDAGKMDNGMSADMKAMMDKMNGMQMTGNTDKDYVMMMIPHHEGAVTMAKDELTLGKKTELKKMAQKMIDDQTKEIADFKAWLNSHK